jgi:iron uptake system component EfeO
MPRVLLVPALAATAVVLAACGSSGGGAASADAIKVTSTKDACTLSATSVAAGPTTFAVTNKGSDVTEFYLYSQDGQRIVGEVENIGPGLTQNLTVVLPAGTYESACKPGMVGDGIRAAFTATGTGESPAASGDAAALTKAAADYEAYVSAETAELLVGTTAFVAAVKDGDIDKAKELYAPTREHYEAIEPVAESFGDLDPRIDARKNDVEAGQEWTGWHRLEKALWVDKSLKGMDPFADQLLADTKDLVTKVGTIDLAADQITNGAKELLDEVATSKVTGEEERYSHTDLWAFQGNVDGAKKAYEVVEPVVATKDPALKAKLDAAFADLQTELDLYKVGAGYVLYTDLTDAQVKELAAKVEALSEPLSELTVTVVS